VIASARAEVMTVAIARHDNALAMLRFFVSMLKPIHQVWKMLD
jgi:hypothetical protein